MLTFKRQLIRTGLDALYFSGVHRLLGRLCGGVGAVLMLQHVRPPRFEKFQPNRGMEIVPGFLEQVCEVLRDADIDLVSLDEMHRRMTAQDFRRRFVCLTFDEGYRDTKEWAYPILKRHEVPFAIYVPTGFPDRIGTLWWLVLERVIANTKSVAFLADGVPRRITCASLAEKRQVYDYMYAWLRGLPTNKAIIEFVSDLAMRYSVDPVALCNDHCMSWNEVGELAEDPLVTIGAQTVNHVILSKASDAAAKSEMRMGRAVLQAALGMTPAHFAYPFGDRSAAGAREFQVAQQAGYKTAVTTRPGMLFAEHADHLLALPRLWINGEFQRERYVQVLLSGTGAAVSNGFRRLNVA
jgi:peptidoglycan/xylan/chitin deacetylase (PgdA/CDA1 family)